MDVTFLLAFNVLTIQTFPSLCRVAMKTFRKALNFIKVLLKSELSEHARDPNDIRKGKRQEIMHKFDVKEDYGSDYAQIGHVVVSRLTPPFLQLVKENIKFSESTKVSTMSLAKKFCALSLVGYRSR